MNEVGKSYYSEGIIFTSTPHWTNNAEAALRDRDKNIARIDLTQLQESRVDWSKFSLTIQKSKDITAIYQYIINEFVDDEDVSNAYQGDIQHVDGSMNALEKNQKIDGLKAEIPENSVKMLSNTRFLTEDVDVPNLDAVIFL